MTFAAWVVIWLALFVGGPVVAGAIVGAVVATVRKRARGYRWHRPATGGFPYLARRMSYSEVERLPCSVWRSLSDRQRVGLDPVYTSDPPLTYEEKIA